MYWCFGRGIPPGVSWALQLGERGPSIDSSRRECFPQKTTNPSGGERREAELPEGNAGQGGSSQTSRFTSFYSNWSKRK